MKFRPSRAIFCLVLMLVVSAILGGVFGGQVRATTKGEEDVDTAIKHFSTLLGLVEEPHVVSLPGCPGARAQSRTIVRAWSARPRSAR